MWETHWPKAVSFGLALILGGGSFVYWLATKDANIFAAGMVGAVLWWAVGTKWEQPLD